MTIETPKTLQRLGTRPQPPGTFGEAPGRCGHTFVAMWPIDPDVKFQTAVNEGKRRVRAMLAQAAVELLGEGAFTTTTLTADEGNLAADVLVFRCPARALPSVFDPFLPSDVLIRENGHSSEKCERVDTLLAQGMTARDIADMAGVNIRQVERIKAHRRVAS